MPDVTDVPDSKGPSLEDIADVLARTNRGLLQLEKMVTVLRDLCLWGFILIGTLIVRHLKVVS